MALARGLAGGQEHTDLATSNVRKDDAEDQASPWVQARHLAAEGQPYVARALVAAGVAA